MSLLNVAASPAGGTMDTNRIEAIWGELGELLKKQAAFLEAKTVGGVTDAELLEYAIRQEVTQELCDQLAQSAAA